MKICATLAFLFLSSVAHSEEGYRTVEQYIDRVMNGAVEAYTCHVSSGYPKYRGCSLGSLERVPGISRVFGILQVNADQAGFIFVLEPHGEESIHVAAKSHPFTMSEHRLRGVFAVEALNADADDRFHIQFTSGSMGRPDSDIYRFKPAKLKLVQARFSFLARKTSTQPRSGALVLHFICISTDGL